MNQLIKALLRENIAKLGLSEDQNYDAEAQPEPTPEEISKVNNLDSIVNSMDANQSEDNVDAPKEKSANIDFTYDVPVHKEYLLRKAIETTKKMAHKLKLPEPVITISPKVRKGFTDSNGDRFAMEVYPVRVQAEGMFKMGGYNLLAIVDNASGGSILIGGNKVPTSELGPSQECDLCHTRRARGKSYVVLDLKTGELQRFGGDCIKKVYGINPAKYISALEYISNLQGVFEEGMDVGSGGGRGGGGFNSTNRIVDFDKALSLIKSALDEVGYVKKEFEPATQGRYGHGGYAPPKRSNLGKATSDRIEPIINDKEKFDSIKVNESLVFDFKAFWNAFKIPDNINSGFSEFLVQIKDLVADGQFRIKDTGLIIYAMYYYLEQEKKKNKPESNYVGNVGENVLISNAKLLKLKTFDSQYGTQSLWFFEDENGNELKKFGVLSPKFKVADGNGEELGDNKAGDVFTFVAEIKKHEIYNGVKSTLLGRLGAPSKKGK